MRIVFILFIIYLIGLVTVFLRQRRLLYFPATMPLPLAMSVAQRVGFEPWENAGHLIGWKQLSKAPGPHDRVLIAHGNAGSALDRSDYAQGINQTGSWDVYVLEYPGYGPRPGSPSEMELFRAGDEAMKLLEKAGPVFVIGESLGTGVAAYLAGTFPQAVSGVLLVAPYHNLGDVAQAHMPIFPARWMLKDKFRSGHYLATYHGRLAVLLGDRDTVVPTVYGRKLYDSYHGGLKKLWVIPNAGHNDLPNQPSEWWKEMVSFWKS